MPENGKFCKRILRIEYSLLKREQCNMKCIVKNKIDNNGYLSSSKRQYEGNMCKIFSLASYLPAQLDIVLYNTEASF